MTSVIGKTKDEVISSLARYAISVGGGLEMQNIPIDHDNCCVIQEANGNTTIFNPYAYLEWDRSSEFISKDLNAAVFSFHIHDGDLWMYVLFVNGNIVDQFNPIPDYWDANISEEEIHSYKGNADIISQYISAINPISIERYLVRWELEAYESEKAYPEDQFVQEDWQLLDFMRKLKLPYPLDDNGTPSEQTYKLWTKELPVKRQNVPTAKPTEGAQSEALSAGKISNKPWWKFW